MPIDSKSHLHLSDVLYLHVLNNHFVFALFHLGCATNRDCGLNKDDNDEDHDTDNLPNSSYSLA